MHGRAILPFQLPDEPICSACQPFGAQCVGQNARRFARVGQYVGAR